MIYTLIDSDGTIVQTFTNREQAEEALELYDIGAHIKEEKPTGELIAEMFDALTQCYSLIRRDGVQPDMETAQLHDRAEQAAKTAIQHAKAFLEEV